MAMRPPATPRSAAGIPTPSRRKSLGPLPSPARPTSSLSMSSASDSAEALSELRSAIQKHDPARYGPPSPEKLRIGDVIRTVGLDQPFVGMLRYLGPVGTREGIFAGVELMHEWVGKGKNDGSALGQRYFECAPNNGIFVPAAKVELEFATPTSPVPMPSTSRPVSRASASAQAAAAAQAKITQGSRASKYLGVTAAQLAQRTSPGPTTPTTLRTSVSAATPTLSRSRARPSIGGVTPRVVSGPGIASARKSVGPGDTATTPTALRTSKRAAVGLGVGQASTPEPSLPSGRATPGSTRAVSGRATPSAVPLGRRTPSLPSAMRRISGISTTSTLADEVRPETPGVVRPGSRVSSTASAGSHGFEAHLLRTSQRDDRDWESVQKERLAAVDRANEADKALKLGQARFEELRLRLEASDGRVKELEEQLSNDARISGDRARADAEAADARLRELEAQLTNAHAARGTGEQSLTLLRAEFAAHQTSATSEKLELVAQVDQLREAGQALCSVYEERIAGIETERRDLEGALGRAEAALTTARQRERERDEADAAKAAAAADEVPRSKGFETPMSPAQLIDNETLRAEVEHLRNRLATVEDQRDEAIAAHEQEVVSGESRRTASSESEQALRSQLKTLKERVDQAKSADASAAARHAERHAELEQALAEAHRTLEREQHEVERLRAEVTAAAEESHLHQQRAASTQHLESDLELIQRELAAARAEADEHKRRCEDMAEELRLTEELSRAETDAPTTPTNKIISASDLEAERTRHRRELEIRDEELRSLRPKPRPMSSESLGLGEMPGFDRRGSAASLASTVSRRQAPSPGSPIPGKDEIVAMREQIVGLKVILEQVTEENRELIVKNEKLVTDSANERRSSRPVDDPFVATSVDTSELQAKLADTEKRSAREIASLNAEVQDLEALVESKIFREDELETELDRYKKLVDKARSAGFVVDNGRSSSKPSKPAPTDEACELCNEHGHDLSHCPIFSTSATVQSLLEDNGRPFCTDCLTEGHDSRNCPNADELF